MHARLWMILVGTLFLFVGCPEGDDDTGDDDTGDDDDAADDDSADDDDTGELSVAVVYWDEEANKTVLEGATVTLDKPGGERVAVTSDAEGKASFTGIDWSLGAAAVCADGEDLDGCCEVGIIEADGEVELAVAMHGLQPDLVELSGTAVNMVAEGNILLMSATAPSAISSQATGPSFSLQVPRGVSFDLVGAEFHGTLAPDQGVAQVFDRWSVIEVDACKDDTTLDPDLAATEVTPVTVAGSFAIPTREDSPISDLGTGYFYVFSQEDLYASYTGFPTQLEISEDGDTFEYTGEYIEVDSVPNPVTYYTVFWDSYASWSVVDGYPADGDHDPGLPDAPVLMAPGSPGDEHPFYDPIQFEVFDEGLIPRVYIACGSTYVWWVSGPAGATEITIPALPDGAADILECSGTISAWLRLIEFDETKFFAQRGVDGGAFTLVP
jgi:hypothetical protein